MKKKIITSTLINMVNLAFRFIISFAMTPIILNRIGTDQYGIWVFLGIFSISGYFSLLDMGMQGAAIKYVAEYHAKGDIKSLNDVINTVIFFFLSVGLIGGGILALFNNTVLFSFFNVSAQYQAIVKVLINLLAVSFLFQFPAMGFSAVIEGLQRYDILRVSSIVISVVTSVITIMFLTVENGIVFLTVLSVLSSFALAFAYYCFSRRLLPEIRLTLFGFKFSSISGLFNMSWQLFISRLVGLVFNNTDKILIGIFLTMSAMTNYDIVNKVHLLMLMVMSCMNQALVPFTSKLSAQNDDENLKVLFLRGTKYAVLVSMPLLLFLMVMSREFIAAWIGEEYSSLSLLSVFYLSHCFLTVLTGVASTMLVGMNKVKEMLIVSVSMAVLNLIISLFGVNTFGIAGLIGGTVIAYIIGQIMYLVYFMRLFKVRIAVFVQKVVFKPYLLSVVIAFLLFSLKHHIAFGTLSRLFFLGGAVYIVFFVVYLLMDDAERAMVFNRLRAAGKGGI